MPKLLVGLLVIFLVACSEELTTEQYIDRAHGYMDAADYESAQIELKNALQLDASRPDIRCLLGKLHMETGNYPDAVKELERGRALGCSADIVLPRLAQAHMYQGDFDRALEMDATGLGADAEAQLLSTQAVAALSKGQPQLADEMVVRALAKSPESVDARLARARLLALQGESQKAVAMIDQVLLVAPLNDEAWRLRGHTLWRSLRLLQARESFDKAIELSRLPIADYISRSLINILMEDYSAAQIDAAALNEIAVNHPGSNYVTGLLLFRAGEYRDAITMLSLGEAAAAKYPLMLFYLSMAHIIDGDAKVAETYVKRFLDLAPQSLEGRKLLAVLLMQKGDVENVEIVLRPVLDHDPNDLGALNVMANTLLISDKADLGMFTFDWITKVHPDIALPELQITQGLFTSTLALSAGPAVQKALKPLPQFPREDIFTILEKLKANDHEGAIAAAESYKWRDLTGIAPYNVLGNVFVALKKKTAARLHFEQALKHDPGNPSANLKLANLEREEGDLKAERARYDAILQVYPTDLPAMIALALLEGREGDNGDMVEQLEEAVVAHPSALEPRLGLARYYLDSGRPRRVEGVFKDFPDLQKHSDKVRSLRYSAFIKQEREVDALALAKREFARQPSTKTVMEVVFLFRSAGQAEEVRGFLEHWLDDSPQDVTARLTLASELEQTDKAAATAHYRKIVQLAPNNLVALNNLAWNIRESEPSNALVYIRKAAELAPSRAAILDSLAVIAHLNGEHEEAFGAIRKALKQDPENPSMLYHEAMIHVGRGKTNRAATTLQELLAKKGVSFPERKEAEQLLATLQG